MRYPPAFTGRQKNKQDNNSRYFFLENKCLSCCCCCSSWALFEYFFYLFYVLLGHVGLLARLWVLMQRCCFGHEEHYFIRNMFFVFQLFMTVVSSKSVAPHSAISKAVNGTAIDPRVGCVFIHQCVCVWTVYFPQKNSLSSSHRWIWKWNWLIMISCKVWWCNVIGRGWVWILLPGDKRAQPFNAMLLCSLFSG